MAGVAVSVAFGVAASAGSGGLDAKILAATKGGADPEVCTKPSELVTSGCAECESYAIGWYRKCSNNPTASACVPASGSISGYKPTCLELAPECGGIRTYGYTTSNCTGSFQSYDTCTKNYSEAASTSGPPGSCP